MFSASIRRALAGTIAFLFLASGCSATQNDDPSGASPGADASGAFPVTIEHALGSATIPSEPKRVVTWGYGSTDAVLALGVVPVAIPQQPYGGDEQGLLPWVADELTELGAETPTILPNETGTEVPFEMIAAATPDVILANYSGITADDYAKLSAMAPTVAYPGEAWATPWREVVTTVGQALGKTAEAEKLLADSDAMVAEQAAAHPEFADKTIALVWDTPGDAFYVYKEADPRTEFLTALGFTIAPSVKELDTDESTFFFTMSREELDKLTSDVLLVYAADQAELDTFVAQPYAQTMSQIKDETYAPIVGEDFVAAVSPPTILSLPWSLDDYTDALTKAAA